METLKILQGQNIIRKSITNNINEIKSDVVKFPEEPYLKYSCQVSNINGSSKKNTFYINIKITYTSFITRKLQVIAEYSFEVTIPENTKLDTKVITWRESLLKAIFKGIEESTNSTAETKGYFPIPSDGEIAALNELASTFDIM